MNKSDLEKTRYQFHDLVRRAYPNVGEPGVIWVLIEVLGYTWEQIELISIDGFSREGYRTFVIDPMTNTRLYSQDAREFVHITRKWTKEEKAKLRDWWWLLGY